MTAATASIKRRPMKRTPLWVNLVRDLMVSLLLIFPYLFIAN